MKFACAFKGALPLELLSNLLGNVERSCVDVKYAMMLVFLFSGNKINGAKTSHPCTNPSPSNAIPIVLD
jgi:hypothetical protein